MMLPPPSKHIEAQDPSLIRLSRWIYAAWLVWALASLLLVIVLNVLGLALSLFALGGLLLTVIVHLYHRSQVEAFYHYRELEAYFSLFASLKIAHPLPPMRLWRISPDFATQIVMLVRKHQPALVVEIGSGVSTIITAYCLQEREAGRVVSVEHEADFAAVSAEGVADHGLSAWAEVRPAPLKPVSLGGATYAWYDVGAFDDLHDIDLLTVDGPPEGTGAMARYPALPLLYDKLRPGALILVDDFMREGEYQMVTRWLAEFDLDLVYTESNEKGVAVLRKRDHTVPKR